MITGIVLAGGKSKRIGIDKSLLYFNKKPLIYNIIESIRPYVKEIIVITNEKEKYSFLKNVSFKNDIIKNKGAMGGIYTGLNYSKNDFCFVVGCDMPYIKGELIPFLFDNIKNKLGSVPYVRNKFEPLSSIYNIKLKKFFYNFIKKENLKLQNLLYKINISKINTKYIYNNFGKNIFKNINTKEDYIEIIKGYIK